MFGTWKLPICSLSCSFSSTKWLQMISPERWKILDPIITEKYGTSHQQEPHLCYLKRKQRKTWCVLIIIHILGLLEQFNLPLHSHMDSDKNCMFLTLCFSIYVFCHFGQLWRSNLLNQKMGLIITSTIYGCWKGERSWYTYKDYTSPWLINKEGWLLLLLFLRGSLRFWEESWSEHMILQNKM